MAQKSRGVAVVTGASSGIGAVTSIRLAREGFEVVLGARRMDRLEKVAAECGGTAVRLDVTDPSSVEEFCSALDHVTVLVNNAGAALGLEPLEEISDDKVEAMFEVNVMSVIRMTRALLPVIEAGDGHIVNVGSIAGFETYRGGGGYTAAKHAVRALTKTLRLELLGKPIRVTEIDPAHVLSEFALVRFEGDQDRADDLYTGFTPLSPEDVADAIAWAVTRPPNVNVDQIVLRSISQATATDIARSGES